MASNNLNMNNLKNNDEINKNGASGCDDAGSAARWENPTTGYILNCKILDFRIIYTYLHITHFALLDWWQTL